MITLKILIKGAFIIAAVVTFAAAFADNKVDIEDFVDEASAKGVAEIETAKIALQTSISPGVREYAQKMIDDHTKANQELANIARKKDLDVADDAELMSQAKAFILDLRDGDSFDIAYANNQVVAHENTLELFNQAALSKDPEISAFAKKMLPKLEQHLSEARDLVRSTKSAETEPKTEGAAPRQPSTGTSIDRDNTGRTNMEGKI